MRALFHLTLAITTAAAISAAVAASSVQAYIAAAVADPHRPADDVKRDTPTASRPR